MPGQPVSTPPASAPGGISMPDHLVSTSMTSGGQPTCHPVMSRLAIFVREHSHYPRRDHHPLPDVVAALPVIRLGPEQQDPLRRIDLSGANLSMALLNGLGPQGGGARIPIACASRLVPRDVGTPGRYPAPGPWCPWRRSLATRHHVPALAGELREHRAAQLVFSARVELVAEPASKEPV